MKYLSLVLAFAILSLSINALVFANLVGGSSSVKTNNNSSDSDLTLSKTKTPKKNIVKSSSPLFSFNNISLETSYVKNSEQFNENNLFLAQTIDPPSIDMPNFAAIQLPKASEQEENQYAIINNNSIPYTQYQEVTN